MSQPDITGPRIALETAFLTRGLPEIAAVDTAKRMARAARAAGAAPSYIGVLDGEPVIAMTDAQLETLAERGGKLSTKDLPLAIARRASGGTTVAATMYLARREGIDVMATGGIGGVHAGGGPADVSADLVELSRTPIVLVCSGAKAILDLPATVERLETLGVLVLGLETDEWPAFWTPTSGIRLVHRVDTVAEVAAAWEASRAMDAPGAIVVCVAPPPEKALSAEASERAVEEAIALAEEAGIRGADVTPFLLDRIVQHTEGRSLDANIALLVNNAEIAARIARAIAVS